MHYTTIASQLKAKHPEYANRDDRELVEKYVQRFPEKASFIEFDDYEETPAQTQQEKKPITKEDVGDYLKGASQTVSQGLMFGQAPHVSGVLNESLNTPKKIYNAQSLRDLVDVYKGLGKDYVKSREQFKEEQGKFAEENPKTALALEILGSLGSGGGLSFLRGGRSLLRQALKGGVEGSAIGSLYGASNTKGQGVDLKGAGLGAILGGGLGSSLGVALPVGQKIALKSGDLLGTLGRLWGKGVDSVADRVTPVKYIKNPMREIQKAEEKALIGKEPIIDVDGVEVKPEVSQNILPSVQNPLREVESTKLPATKSRDILANPKSVEDAYTHGIVRSYLPEQNFVIDDIINDSYVRREVAQGIDVGRNFDKYGKEAIEELKNIKKVVKDAENEAYAKAGVTDDYMLDGNKFVEDIENAINKFKQDSRTYKQNEGEGDKFLNNVLEEWTKNNGQISFGKLKVLTRDAHNNRIKAKRDNSKGEVSSEFDLWKDISRIISDTKNADANLKVPNKMYSELSDAIEDLEFGTGIKLDNPRTFARKVFSSARDRADGGIFDQSFDDFTDIINKYEGTKVLGELPSKIRMAKVSYVLRNSGKDNKLSKDVKRAMTPSSWAKRKLAEKLAGKDISSEDYYKIIAQRLEKGELKPEDLDKTFRRISIAGLSDDEANEMYVKYLLLGNKAGILPSVLSNMVKGGIK